MVITTLFESQCVLGESPFWHHERNSCFWTDINDGTLFEYNWSSGEVHKRFIADHLSLVIEGSGDNIIMAVKGGLMRMNLSNGHKTWLMDIDKHIPNNRCNDGACDAKGRLWIGTMDKHCAANAGSLYRIEKDLSLKKMFPNLTIPNGLVWSLNNDRMFFIDSPSQNVAAYLFDDITGEIKFDKIAVKIPKAMGTPDGMVMDSEGMLWVALYGGGCVTRWNPENGQLIKEIKFPAPNITSCAFTGEKLDSLIVTSARENLTEQQLAQYPESGNVFLVKNFPFTGLPNNIAHF